MKILRLAVLSAGAAWFLHPRRGSERRARALDFLRGLGGRARGAMAAGGPEVERSPSGGGRRRAARPEVREVKSPAELEPGIFSASPEPPSRGRDDRRARRRGQPGAMVHGPLPDELEPTAEDWRHGDVTPRVELVEPPQGDHLTEAHLGVYVPQDDLEPEEPEGGLRADDEDAAPEPARGVPPGPDPR